MKTHVIILAGGVGSRFGETYPKQFALLDGKPILQCSIESFLHTDNLKSVIIVGNTAWKQETEDILCNIPFSNDLLISFVEGGPERQDSSRNGVYALKGIAEKKDIILIHDAARPCVSPSLINNVIRGTRSMGAVVPILPIADSIIEEQNGIVIQYGDRKRFHRVQTPQGFQYFIIVDAHKNALLSRLTDAPDDGSLVINAGYPVGCVEGSETNIKVTSHIDLAYLSRII